MLERTDAIMNEVLEPITFVLANPTVCRKRYSEYHCSVIHRNKVSFWDVFVKLRKENTGFLKSVRPSSRIKQLGRHWTDFRVLLHLSSFRKSVKKIQVSIKSDKNIGFFTCRPIYSYNHITPNSSYLLTHSMVQSPS